MAVSNNSAIVVSTVAALSMLAGYGLHAYAEGAPTTKPIFYAGTLEANGRLASGTHAISLSLFDSEMAGKQLCVSDAPDTPVDNGRFRVEVSADCVATLKAQPDVWAALRFTGPDGVPHELPKRSKVGAVPYAMEAQHAVSASTSASANAAAGTLANSIGNLQGELTAARNAIAAVVGSSAVSVAAAAAVSVPVNTFVNLPFSTVEWDLLNEYSASTGFTAKNAGIYQVCASVYWGAVIASEVDVFIDGNRTRALGSASGSTCGGCVDVRLNAGQRMQVSAYHTNGAPQTVAVNSLWSYLNIHRIY